MKREKHKYYLHGIIWIIMSVFFLLVVGCSSEDTRDVSFKTPYDSNATEEKNATETKNEKIQKQHMEVGLYYATFVPLTLNKFQAIRNNENDFSLISVRYKRRSNIDPNGHADHQQFFEFQAGFGGTSRLWESIEFFEGGTYLIIKDITPKEGIGYSRIFTPEDIDLIFDYLEDNHEFFFNNEEYNGLDIPYLSRGSHIGQGNIKFSLIFLQPNDMPDAWAISKCMDEPDAIMQGLIDILEEHFIDEFE